MMKEQKKPLVSIWCPTYNHEKFIAYSINSFLSQKTNFKIEIVIHDDASTDNTKNIILNFKKSNPDTIKTIFQKENKYSKDKEFLSKAMFTYTNGKYIAICEGDDYWTDPYKLQKQIDFLESNPNFQVCFTNTSVVDSNNLILKNSVTRLKKNVFEHKDMPVYAPTLTRVFRKIQFPVQVNEFEGRDSFMLVYQSKFGKIKFLDEVTAAYRQHDNGVWSGISKSKQINTSMRTSIACLEIIEDYMFPKYLGMLLGSLLKLKVIDTLVFNEMNILINQKLKEYKSKLSFKNYLIIKSTLLLINSKLVNYHTIRTKVKSTIKTLKTSV